MLRICIGYYVGLLYSFPFWRFLKALYDMDPYLISTFLKNTRKTTIATEDVLELNILRGTKTGFLTP